MKKLINHERQTDLTINHEYMLFSGPDFPNVAAFVRLIGPSFVRLCLLLKKCLGSHKGESQTTGCHAAKMAETHLLPKTPKESSVSSSKEHGRITITSYPNSKLLHTQC